MKRFLIVTMALVCVMGVSAPASAVLLDWDLYGIGTRVPGSPAGDEFEEAGLSYLISLVNGAPVIPNPDGNVYTQDLGTVTAAAVPLPYPASFEDKDLSGNTTFTLPGSFTYLLAKFGNNDAFYYIAGLSGEFTIDPPDGWSGQGFGLSHISYFNGTTTQVPEAGALIMFASGLAGLVGYRRMRRMQ